MSDRDTVKLNRKEVKKPDAFLEFMTKLATFSADRSRYLITLLIAFVLVVVFYGILKTGLRKNENRASTELAEITRQLDEAAPGPEVALTPPPPGEPSEPTDKVESLKQIEKRTNELIKKYKGTSSGEYARMVMGKIRLLMGDYAGAVESFEAFLGTKVAKANSMRAAGLVGLATSYERIGNLAKSSETWERVLALKGSIYEAVALLGLARAQAAMGNQDAAIATYQRLVNDVSDPSLSAFAKAQIQLLKRGKKLPAPSAPLEKKK